MINYLRSQPVSLLLLCCWLILLSGCQSRVVTGAGNKVHIASIPSKAICKVSSRGKILVRKLVTPASITVDDLSEPLHLLCNKEGYKEAQVDAIPNQMRWNVNPANLVNGYPQALGISIDFYDNPQLIVVDLVR